MLVNEKSTASPQRDLLKESVTRRTVVDLTMEAVESFASS